MNALKSVLLVVLGPLYQTTHSWAWALLLLAIIAQAIPILIDLFAPQRDARRAFHRDLDELSRQHPKRDSETYRNAYNELKKKHAPPRWWLPFLLASIWIIVGVRIVGYGGLYQLLVHDPLPAGKPLLWMRDVTQPMSWWLAIPLFLLIWILHDCVRILHVDGVADLSKVAESDRRVRWIKNVAWSGLLAIFAAEMPSGLTFYYVANMIAYLLVVLPIAIALARLRRRRHAKSA